MILSNKSMLKKNNLLTVIMMLGIFIAGILLIAVPAEADIPSLDDTNAFSFSGTHQNTKVNRQDNPKPWTSIEFPTGIKSNEAGNLIVTFEPKQAGAHSHNGLVKRINFEFIEIIELSTGDVYNNPDVAPTISGHTIVIPHKAFRPGEMYRLNIQETSISYGNTTDPSDFDQDSNFFISWRFTAERKPKPLNIIFEPSGQTFPLDPYPPTVVYPEFLGEVHAHGIDVNSTVLVEFENGILIESAYELSILPSINTESSTNANLLTLKSKSTLANQFFGGNTTYIITLEAGALKDIDGGSLKNDRIQFRFRTADNFKRAIMDNNVTNLNFDLFFQVPSRYIGVQVPKRYITEVETIHHIRGLIPMDASSNTQENLTNIEIRAASEVHSITIKTNRATRPFIQRRNNTFSASFAGLEADITYLEISAFDRHGKLLEEYKQRLEVDGTNPLKVYNRAMPTGVSGTHTLYDLMSNAALMQNIVNHFPVSQLDKIGIFLPHNW